jgi:hypothetical protein
MSVLNVIDRAHAAARRSQLLFRITLATRYLFAMGFIPTGAVKALGHRFTSISPDLPVGAFFEAMYQTDEYWRFIGITQILAGILLVFPRTALLGAVAFFPIILNIFVITWALEFQGTPFVTGAMLFGAMSLLAWDWHRLRAIVTTTPSAIDPTAQTNWVMGLGPWWERLAWYGGLASGLAVLFAARNLATSPAQLQWAIGAGAVCAVLALIGTVQASRQVVHQAKHATHTR